MFTEELEDSTNKSENQEFLPENQRFLERIEQEYLQDLASGEFIKNWLEIIVFNSMNIFVSLWSIQLGLGVLMSCIIGFTVGSVPAFKKISSSFSLYKDSDGWKSNMNSRIVLGFAGLILAAFNSYSATREWKNLEYIADKAQRYYIEDICKYEKDCIKDNMNKWLLVTGVGALGGAILISTIKKN